MIQTTRKASQYVCAWVWRGISNEVKELIEDLCAQGVHRALHPYSRKDPAKLNPGTVKSKFNGHSLDSCHNVVLTE